MILVTGANGHIGNVLVRELCAMGKQVRALLLPGEDRTPLSNLDVEIVEGNVLSMEDMRAAVKGVEVVYHLAALISILPGRDELVERVNVQGTQNAIRAATESGVRRFVYTSSIHAIERVPEGITIDEQIPFNPRMGLSAYDSSKAIATLEVLKATREGLDAVVACPTGVIGPHDYRRSEMGQLILDTMNSKLHLSVQGAYDFVDVRDIARGLILACDLGKSGEHYILSGERVTVPELMSLVREVSGKRALQVRIPLQLAKMYAWLATPFYRLAKVPPRFTEYALETVTSNSHISHAKASRELGYAPRSIRQSIADTVQWFMENGHLLIHPRPLRSVMVKA